MSIMHLAAHRTAQLVALGFELDAAEALLERCRLFDRGCAGYGSAVARHADDSGNAPRRPTSSQEVLA